MKLSPFKEADFVFEFPTPPESLESQNKKKEVELDDSSAKTIGKIPIKITVEERNSPKELYNHQELRDSPPINPPGLLEIASIPITIPSPEIIPIPKPPQNSNPAEAIPTGHPVAGKSRELSPSSSQMTSSPQPQIASLEVNEAIRLNKIHGIEICLESTRDFIAAQPVEISLYIRGRDSEIRLENVQVLIKVIGTNLSPRIYSGKTDRYGNLKINFTLPEYKIGSAALIIQASTQSGDDQVKYLIKRK